VANPPFVAESLYLRDLYERGELVLSAPANLRYEVCGAVHNAIATRQLNPVQVRGRLQAFLDLPFVLVESANLILDAHRLSLQYSSSFYDSLYLALAEQLQVPLVHADRRLKDSLRGRFRRELWIEEVHSIT
jgi:predicted nucleic acid-binding protein